MDRYRELTLRLITILLVAGMMISVSAFAVDLIGIDMSRQIWLLRVYVFGPEPVGIFRQDDVYGWTHIPSSVGRQRVVPDYDAIYHIDSLGHRRTPQPPPPGAPQVLFLGGSFTFGHGVNDTEPYPALLQRTWPDLKVVNAATNAWGTAQAYLALNDEFEKGEQTVLVVYAFITHHLQRNYLRKRWLDRLIDIGDRRNPYFELTRQGRLVFRGLADSERDGLPHSNELMEQEALITEKLIAAMAMRCAQRGVPFVVVILPDGTQTFGASIVKRGAGDQAVIDLRPLLDNNQIRYAHDIHLHPEGHREVADILRPLLEKRMAHLKRSNIPITNNQ